MTNARTTHLAAVERREFIWARRWQDLPIGGIIPEPGTSRHYSTGDWRTKKPAFNPYACANCLLCWIYCPDGAIMLEEGRVVGINYEYCKGCGICAHECPREGALAMVANREEMA